MPSTQTDYYESRRFVTPPGYQRQVRKTRRANRYRRSIEYTPFVILPHPEFQFGAKIVHIIRIISYEHQDFSFRMSMGFAAPVPLSALAVKSPGEVELETLKVFSVKPYHLITISRPDTHRTGSHQ